MPIYVRDLPEPVQQLVRSMNRECTPEELQMLSLANSKVSFRTGSGFKLLPSAGFKPETP